MKQHYRIMNPDQTELGLEGIFAVTAHLGEGVRPRKYTVNGVRHMEGAEGLSNLEKIIFYESGMTAQGDAVVPHEDRSRRPWFKFAGGIKHRLGCTAEEAETLLMAFEILDTTAKMAVQFEKWLKTPDKFQSGYRWFQDIASQLVLCTDEGEPRIITTTLIEEEDEYEASEDHPADIIEVSADAWHKLDDDRDELYDPDKNETAWEAAQPPAFKSLIRKINRANLADLKIIGKSLFADKKIAKQFSNIQMTVIWDNYHRAKARLSPKLSPIAKKALCRIAEKADLRKVAEWLHDTKQPLTEYDRKVIWSAWHKMKKKAAQKQAPLAL